MVPGSKYRKFDVSLIAKVRCAKQSGIKEVKIRNKIKKKAMKALLYYS